jgi:competence protein ComEC
LPDNSLAYDKNAKNLTVYYIDVGQADSALVICEGDAMLIDGGNAEDSSLIYTFLKNRNIGHLNYLVATHAHEDHIGGLAGALNYASIGTAFCPVTEYDSKVFNSFLTYLDRQNVKITVPKPGDTFTLGGANVKILAPLKETEEVNNTSIVLRIVYGQTSFLFTGDAEREEETDILEAGYNLESTVLKVGHHGSYSSTTYPFLREIMPGYAVISAGANNPYGHPHEETLSKLRDAEIKIYRTDLQGTISAVSDGNTVKFTTEKNQTAQANPAALKAPETTETYYIGNINSRKLHSPGCNSLPLEKNRVYFDTISEALAAGYDKHKECLP